MEIQDIPVKFDMVKKFEDWMRLKEESDPFADPEHVFSSDPRWGIGKGIKGQEGSFGATAAHYGSATTTDEKIDYLDKRLRNVEILLKKLEQALGQQGTQIR